MDTSIESTIEFIKDDVLQAARKRLPEGLGAEFWEGYLRAAQDFSELQQKLGRDPSMLAELIAAAPRCNL